MSNAPTPGGVNPGIVIARTRLFIASYAPLLFIFAALQESWLVGAVLVALGLVGLATAWSLIRPGRRTARTVVFHDIHDKGNEVSGYLATYLLPFVSAPPESLRAGIAYGIYGLIAYLVFIRSSLGLVNPALSLLGYSVIEARVGTSTAMVVCRRPPVDGQPVSVYGIMGGNGYLLR